MQRLVAVHATGLIGTPSEERIDRCTRLAQRMFDMPIALVNLVGSGKGWVKYDPEQHRSIDDLVRDADSRMYAHKQALSETTA